MRNNPISCFLFWLTIICLTACGFVRSGSNTEDANKPSRSLSINGQQTEGSYLATPNPSIPGFIVRIHQDAPSPTSVQQHRFAQLSTDENPAGCSLVYENQTADSIDKPFGILALPADIDFSTLEVRCQSQSVPYTMITQSIEIIDPVTLLYSVNGSQATLTLSKPNQIDNLENFLLYNNPNLQNQLKIIWALHDQFKLPATGFDGDPNTTDGIVEYPPSIPMLVGVQGIYHYDQYAHTLSRAMNYDFASLTPIFDEPF